MPTVIYMTDSVAVVECPYVPSSGQMEEQIAATVEHTVCVKCGIWRDAGIKHELKYNKSQGKEEFKLMCLHPTSPYLAELKSRIQEQIQKQKEKKG